MSEIKKYEPLIKNRGFLPNPIAVNGIPDFADSKHFPKVDGTAAHADFWEEQIQRCVDGYYTGGVFIPGRYYYYLNFCYLQTVKRGYHHPDFVDLDLEFFQLVDYVKANNKGIICIKPRRRGLSEKVTNGIIDYGMRFKPGGYVAGLAAGKDEYIETFLQRIKKANAYRPPELQMHYNVSNKEQYRAGYSIKNSDGVMVLSGSMNNLWARTMDTKPNVFKGELLEDCVFEEAGEFPILQKGFGATKACFAVGDKMVGTPFIFGCVCAGTKVWDNEGNLINIEDLKPENGILGYDGKGVSKETITYWQPPAEKECVRITTHTGRTLECSIDHPILYSKKGLTRGKKEKRKKVAIFTEAQNLKLHEQIAVIESVPVYGTKKLWEPRLIGWLIGDGTYGFDHSPRMANCDSEINNHLLKKFDAKVTKSHITKEGKLYEEIRLKGICQQLRDIGIYGQTKLNKRLPKNIHSYCKKDICELLGGFFDTDGSVIRSTTKQITLTASSFDLLFEVKLLLQKLGIHCTIIIVKAGFKTPKDINDYYRLCICDVKSILCFRDNISFAITYKQERLEAICKAIENKTTKLSKHIKGIRFEVVEKIEFIGMKPIYNLTAGTTHTYIANGIVTHNTGGNINSSMLEFSNMYEEAHLNGLERFEFYADRLMIGCFVGSTNENGEIAQDTPYLDKQFKDKDYSPEQILGCEDTERAREKVLKRGLEMSKAIDREKYYAFLTDNPLSKKELFLRFTSNSFDTESLTNQRIRIEEQTAPGYFKYKLSWKRNEDGTLVLPHEVVASPCGQNDKEDDDYVVMIRSHPVKNQKNLDVAGLDSYDQDEAKSSKSLGAMVVIRRKGHSMKNAKGDSISHKRVPVCLVRMRPKRKEVFYDTCMMVSVYYNLVHNTLVDAGKPAICKHYEDNGLGRMLSPRPKSFESEKSEQTHKYGMLLTGSIKSKPQMIGILQSWTHDESDECWFPHIIEGLMNYDVLQKDSDWDEVDALGLALVRDIDMKKQPTDSDDKEAEKAFELNDWRENNNGHLISTGVSQVEIDEISDPFMKMLYSGELIDEP